MHSVTRSKEQMSMTDQKRQSVHCTYLCFLSGSLLSHPRPCLQPLVSYPAPSRTQSATTHVCPQGLKRVVRMTSSFPHKNGTSQRSLRRYCSSPRDLTYRKQFLLIFRLLGRIVIAILTVHHNLFSSLEVNSVLKTCFINDVT